MTWAEKFVKWFKEGKEDSETILGIPWDVEMEKFEENDVIVASHPKIPYKIGVFVTSEFANLHIDPGITTDAMDLADRMRIYKKLLHINTDLNLLKTGLMGDEDSVVITVDLDLVSVNKQEFNDALTLLIMGATKLIEVLDIADEVTEAMMERNAAYIIDKLEKGETKEMIMLFLTKRVGLETEYAENFVEKIIELYEEDQKQANGVKPAPDNLYR